MNRRKMWWRAIPRVVIRPRPWLLRYLLHLLPAVIMAVLVAVPLLPIFRYPLMAEALNTRSLGDLLEIIQALGREGSSGGLAALGGTGAFGLALLAWLPVQVAGLWLEGGILDTYASDQRPDGRTFRSACGHTFGPFLVLGIGQSLVIGLIVGLAVIVGWTSDVLLPPGIAAAIAIVGLILWGELARVVMVVEKDRHIFRALGRALRLVQRRLGGLSALVTASIGLQALRFLAQRLAGRTMPIPWWALSLVVLQVIQILGVGIRLIRQAGFVGLAQGMTGPAASGTDE